MKFCKKHPDGFRSLCDARITIGQKPSWDIRPHFSAGFTDRNKSSGDYLLGALDILFSDSPKYGGGCGDDAADCSSGNDNGRDDN